MWTRRELLAALGASGASAMLGGWLGACGAGAEKSTSLPIAPLSLDDLLPQILETLQARVPGAFIWSRHSQRHAVSIDSSEQRFDLSVESSVVFGGLGRTLILRNADREQLVQAADRFAADANRAKGEIQALPAVQLLSSPVTIDPANQAHTEFLEPVRQLFARAQEQGGSRIVYRSSYLSCDDVERRLLGGQHNQRLRTVRLRAGALFAAWTGNDVVTALAEASGLGGLEVAHLSDQELARAAQDALAHVHARSAPSGLQDVVLGPDSGGLLAFHAIAKPAFVRGRRPIPKGSLRVSNDPGSGYGSYQRDDRGDIPMLLPLFGNEETANLETGNMRRDSDCILRPMPANVIVAPGTLRVEDLIRDVKEGVFLEGPRYCSLDENSDSVALLCGRGREIRGGRFTGRVFGRLLASAPCGEFLDNTRALGEHSLQQAIEENSVAMSAQSPHWLSRATVEAA